MAKTNKPDSSTTQPDVADAAPEKVAAAEPEPEKGPEPSVAELVERADGKAVEAAEGTGSDEAVAHATAIALDTAKMRLSQVASCLAYGEEVTAPLTDEEHLLLKSAGIDSAAELHEAAAFYERHKSDAEPQAASALPTADAEAPKAEFDEAAVERLRAQLVDDRKRRELGLPLAGRIHAAVDGIHAKHGSTAIDVEGMDEAAMADLTRMAGSMGWTVSIERAHELAILRR